MRRRLVASLLLCLCTQPAYAQVAHPLGVTAEHVALRSGSEAIAARRTLSAGGRGSIWPWVGVGVLGGAAIGGTVVVVQVAKTDDPFMPGVAVGAGVVVGALLGGAIGALLYVITHSTVLP